MNCMNQQQGVRQLDYTSVNRMKFMLDKNELEFLKNKKNDEKEGFYQQEFCNQELNMQINHSNLRLKKFKNQQQQNHEILACNEEYQYENQEQSNITQCILPMEDKIYDQHNQNIEGELCQKGVYDKIFCDKSTEIKHNQFNCNLDHDKYVLQQKNSFCNQNLKEMDNGQLDIALKDAEKEFIQLQNFNFAVRKINLTNQAVSKQKNLGYLNSHLSQIQPNLKSSYFQGSAITNQQIQKQYLSKQVKEQCAHNFDISPQANLNNQLKENFSENNNKIFEQHTKKIEKEQVMMGKINNMLYYSAQNNEKVYLQNNVSQTCNFNENAEGEYYQYYQIQQPNSVQSANEEGFDHQAYNLFKKQENYQAISETYQQDEFLIYESDKLQSNNQTKICEDFENLLKPNEEDQDIIENQQEQQQLYQMEDDEQFFMDQVVSANDHAMENQGDLYFQFSSQHNYNYPLSYQQQQINQISKIDDQEFQEQYHPSQIQSINSFCDGSNFLKQQQALNHVIAKNESSSKIENTETQDITNLESYLSIDNSKNSKSDSVTNKHDLEYITHNQNNSKNNIDQTQDSKSQQNEDIVDQVMHLNKKNIVRNIIRAFKKYFLNKKVNPQAAQQFFPEQTIESSRNQFKLYFVNKKFNNSILKQLIIHPKYGEIFNFFLLHKSNEYLDHSNIKTKKSHELFINYLVLCYSDPSKLTYLETYSKL